MLPESLFALLQKILPQHLLSRITGRLADSEISHIKNPLIKLFINHFDVVLHEAKVEDYRNFKNFNAFFTRELKEGSREISRAPNTVASPADGAISEIGDIELGSIMQAKGQSYSLMSLLAGDSELCNKVLGGKFATIYLSPKDYHRVHMPIDGTLKRMTYVPGKLFSVNQATANQIPGLFARNERLICEFEGTQGPFVMILVGAMIVAGIETIWAGQVAPVTPKLKSIDYSNMKDITLKKGDEMGRFQLGSTVILLFPEKTVAWESELKNATPLKMGECIASIF